ncbi:MAG: DPP IV N-terminal domain-containing protein [Phycisphaerae bacterium]|nr:DPP IV N-terminal domain-containing protein [Phycisphaerae bacterium]
MIRALLAALLLASVGHAQPPATVAESSKFTATSSQEDVQAFLQSLTKQSKRVRMGEMGASDQKRPILVAWLADPPVATPEEAAKSGKVVVVLLGGIHAGECDGKEALLAIVRDLSLADPAPAMFESLVLAFVPNYNPDGNAKVGEGNRPGQAGPARTGVRENAGGLDLNRDFVKVEAPETQALLRLINRADAAALIDTHTTNGSYHRYALTFDGPRHPLTDPGLAALNRAMLLDAAGAAQKATQREFYWYGNFEGDHTRWETYPAEPRYGVQYMGLRNRLGFLTESYSYAPYRERVESQVAFVRALLDQLAARASDVREAIRKADRAAERGEGKVPLRARAAALPEPAEVKGWVEEARDGRPRPTDRPKDYTCRVLIDAEVELEVDRPKAYLIPLVESVEADETARALGALQRHGIRVEELREDIELDVEEWVVAERTLAERPFQGHRLATLRTAEGGPRAGSRRVPAGSLLVRTDQRLGGLGAYLLEPMAADGLATWNFFDSGTMVGAPFPVLRLAEVPTILTIPAAAVAEPRTPPKVLTFEEAFESERGPNFVGSPAGGFSWLDATHWVQAREGRLVKVEAATGRAQTMLDSSRMAEALADLPTVGDRAAEGLARRALGRLDKGRTGAVVEHQGDLYYVKADGSEARRLTASPAREEMPTMSPDGRFVAFVRENDLWVADVATGTERALTTGGTDLRRNGKNDWVYFEEVFNRSWQAYWWSPDSTRIAYLSIDSTPVPTFTIANDARFEQAVERSPYPKPGQANPVVGLRVVTVGGGEPTAVDLSGYDPASTLILGVGWWPDSSAGVALVSNRTQTWVDVSRFGPDGGEPTVLFRETTEAWVDASLPKFLGDGSFLFLSERSGHRHIYRYARDGKLKGQVTDGDWEVRSIGVVDEKAGRVFFSGCKDSPIAENLYRVGLDGSGLTRITSGVGSHRAEVSPDGAMYVDSWSSAMSPTRVALRSTADNSLIRTLDTNPVRDLARYRLGRLEMVTIPAGDGFVMNGSILTPPDFDPGKRYPVWFMTYAGPQSPTVFDSWSARTWDQVLAASGIVVFRADPRSATWQGAKHAWRAYKQLGVQELADIESAVRWLAGKPWVDAARIGMAGHSYGGFMTSYALTHSTLFAAGIAGAPVTDWADYDSIYTERFMLTPQENAEGYRRTSVTRAAKDLRGRLLLVHGMLDDNVHLQNSTRFVRALQQANKPFEMMLYPESRHGIGGRHYQRLQYDFIRRNLGGPESGTTGESGAAP